MVVVALCIAFLCVPETIQNLGTEGYTTQHRERLHSTLLPDDHIVKLSTAHAKSKATQRLNVKP